MSVSLREVLESGGYDITTINDARWLLSKESEFNRLIEEAGIVVEDYEDFLEDQRQDERMDAREYQDEMELNI